MKKEKLKNERKAKKQNSKTAGVTVTLSKEKHSPNVSDDEKESGNSKGLLGTSRQSLKQKSLTDSIVQTLQSTHSSADFLAKLKN